jgi:hypothetical protein
MSAETEADDGFSQTEVRVPVCFPCQTLHCRCRVRMHVACSEAFCEAVCRWRRA